MTDEDNTSGLGSTWPASESFEKITELAREVLRERGLNDDEIEAELHRPPPRS